MLTKLIVRNFKRFETAEIDLGRAVVFVGPNNSGKTTALQSLVLWEHGLRAWLDKRGENETPAKRPGVAINRKDLVALPVPAANLLWRRMHTRTTSSVVDPENGRKQRRTQNVRVDVAVEGVTGDVPWSCGLEFDYQNDESLLCRPLREPGHENVEVRHARFTTIPEAAKEVRTAFLPPMSGLADREFVKQPEEIDFLVGQGQTAQILRNLCWQLFEVSDVCPGPMEESWDDVCKTIEKLFGTTLLPPERKANAEITLQYEERGTRLDISCAGRGLHQTLLLLAYLHLNPGRVLLLDEPDAHLEILRQRQTFKILLDAVDRTGGQVLVASHSEVVLNEAAGRGKVVAFVGRPHTITNRGSQVVKSLTEIGWDLYYEAESAGWILFLEGPTDLAILQAFAETLAHPAAEHLAKPFVHYVSSNVPEKARDLFHGLREAKSDLVGLALFDRIDKPLNPAGPLVEAAWSAREIENYLCRRDVLIRFGRGENPYDLFAKRRGEQMVEAIEELEKASETFGKPSPWSRDVKATDDFLDPLFRNYYKRLGLPLEFRKADYWRLARLVPRDEIDPEVSDKLDLVVQVATRARIGPGDATFSGGA